MRMLMLLMFLVACGSDKDKSETQSTVVADADGYVVIPDFSGQCDKTSCNITFAVNTGCKGRLDFRFYFPAEYNRYDAKGGDDIEGKTVTYVLTNPTPYRDDSITEPTLKYRCT